MQLCHIYAGCKMCSQVYCQLLSVDLDECLDDVCGNNGTCTNNVGSFVCVCQEGYHNVLGANPVCQGL